jgi:EAL domain-containing protein (putative c-di-GMP-specific phosphodiesterase class I)/GGDEF domain-containing protein
VTGELDPVTRLPNRCALTSDRRGGEAATLVLVRIAWSATAAHYGEDSRDRGARAAAAVLSALVPAGAVLARYADDIFAIRVRGNRSRTVHALARHVLAAFEPPIPAGDEEMCGTPVIGIAIGDGNAADQAREAEAALKHAQATGVSVQVYDAAIARAHDRHALIERNLRHAIIEGRVAVLFQPIVSLRSADVVGAEALMRWDCPGLGEVAPAEFIAIADQSRAILRLGEWILREACVQNRRWQLAGFPRIRVTVNVSPRQVAQRDFCRIVRALMESTSLPAFDLEIELTGTALVSRDEPSLRALHAIRQLGVRVSIDEFGSGYSSISDLATLPANTLKLDRAFVQEIGKDRFNTHAARAIVELAHLQGLDVVAVGVENAAQAATLRSMGCDEVQGFFLGEPVSAEALGARLQEDRTRMEAAAGAVL